MQVILLDKVANLGSLGDQVNVKAGYARNFLVPQGKAVPATKKNGTRDIADAVTAAGVKVAKSEVRLPNGVLRNVGEHEVDFQVHSEVFAKVIINVVAE